MLFIALPAVELWLLIEVGTRLGTLPTLAIVIFTGAVGAFLARMQGLGVVADVRERTARGEMPAGSLADGVMILVAAALLVTPGILTDAVGFSLLVPGVRRAIKAFLLDRMRRAIEQNRLRVRVEGFDVDADPFSRRAHDIELESENDNRWIH